MAKDLGWIKLYRSSFNNRLYFSEPFTRWQAWTDLLLLANHQSGRFRVRGVMVEVLRGQTGFSVVELANRWRWSRGKANRFLSELKNEHQIVQQKTNVTTLISIVNYEKYQTGSTANSTFGGTPDGTPYEQKVVQQTDINNNDNNIKEKKKYFNNKPFPENFNGLPEIKNGAALELIKYTQDKNVTKQQVDGLWEVFKIQNLNGENFYQTEEKVYSHFQNWVKNQKFNGAKRNGNNGTSETIGKSFTPD